VDAFRRDTAFSGALRLRWCPIHAAPHRPALELARIARGAPSTSASTAARETVLVRLPTPITPCTRWSSRRRQGRVRGAPLGARDGEAAPVRPSSGRARIAGAQLGPSIGPGVGARLELTLNAGAHAEQPAGARSLPTTQIFRDGLRGCSRASRASRWSPRAPTGIDAITGAPIRSRILLLDVAMPRMGGVEALASLANAGGPL